MVDVEARKTPPGYALRATVAAEILGGVGMCDVLLFLCGKKEQQKGGKPAQRAGNDGGYGKAADVIKQRGGNAKSHEAKGESPLT